MNAKKKLCYMCHTSDYDVVVFELDRGRKQSALLQRDPL